MRTLGQTPQVLEGQKPGSEPLGRPSKVRSDLKVKVQNPVQDGGVEKVTPRSKVDLPRSDLPGYDDVSKQVPPRVRPKVRPGVRAAPTAQFKWTEEAPSTSEPKQVQPMVAELTLGST